MDDETIVTKQEVESEMNSMMIRAARAHMTEEDIRRLDLKLAVFKKHLEDK